MKALNVNPKMYGVTVGGDLPKFHEVLGRDAEFVYGATPWDPELVTLRAGGLIPIARQYPGAREFVEAHKKEFPGAGLSYHSAAGYAGCQIFLEAVKRAGSLESDKVRDVILKTDLHTVFGAFRVDRDEQLGRVAEFVYGATQWEPELVTLRAGGLVPIARQYPGAREFVESYRKEFPGADLSYQTAQGYGACQVLLEGIKRAGSFDGEKVRDALLKMDLHTAFGHF